MKDKIGSKTLAVGVLGEDYSESKAAQFFEDFKGESIDNVVDILGDPWVVWDYDGGKAYVYVIDGKYNNPRVDIDFSGFLLIFKNGLLTEIGIRYGGMQK